LSLKKQVKNSEARTDLEPVYDKQTQRQDFQLKIWTGYWTGLFKKRIIDRKAEQGFKQEREPETGI
jgi:hypothetical protein